MVLSSDEYKRNLEIWNDRFQQAFFEENPQQNRRRAPAGHFSCTGVSYSMDGAIPMGRNVNLKTIMMVIKSIWDE